eukprot:GHVN01089959.1.p3 GENE.GHVN01089959.1~~GHVN01089959.1.p3  ORF type:complete len:298 (+),score=33.79 GHVN01089959.1:1061-1954(+)
MIGKGLAKFNFLVKFSLWMLGCQILALACFSLLSVAVRLKESPIKDAAIGEQGRLQQDASKMFEFMTGTRESAFRKGFRLDLNREGFRKKKRLSEVIETLQKHWDKNFPVHKIDVNRLIRNFKSATIAAVKLKIDKKWPEAEKELIANNATASFNILVYTGGDLDDPSDIAVMQGHPDSNHATFALASTMFGALEGGMINPYIKLEQMLNSPSLGEWAAISAYPGTVIRKYLPEDTKDTLATTLISGGSGHTRSKPGDTRDGFGHATEKNVISQRSLSGSMRISFPLGSQLMLCLWF